MARAPGVALIVACLFLPLALAKTSFDLADPPADEDMAWIYLSNQYTGHLYEDYDDVCDDPRADITNIAASATSERIRFEFAVTDADAPVACGGVAVEAAPQMDGYPFFTIRLLRGLPGGGLESVAAAYTVDRGDGQTEQCIHYDAIDVQTCSAQELRVVDFATVYTADDGGVADLRGVGYRLSAYSVDAYGSWEPTKSKPLLFIDHVETTPGFPLEVPPGE